MEVMARAFLLACMNIPFQKASPKQLRTRDSAVLNAFACLLQGFVQLAYAIGLVLPQL